jgi:HD-like signal output (HDOD) protein
MTANFKRKAPFGLEAWVDALAEMKVVTLSGIIQELTRLTESEESSVPQLARVIMRDPSLTSKIIRVANSVLYNPGRQPMNTVSRAIMHVGFNTVRAICISAIVMESLLEKHPREGLLRQMAASFHAAVQARALCEKFRADAKEEVFVATLLMHLGRLLVWSYRHPVSDQAYMLEMQGAPVHQVEALLGTTYQRLTQEIAAQWNLGETLNQVLAQKDTELDRRGQAVSLGESITSSLETGWDGEQMQATLRKVAAFLGVKEGEARKKIETSMKEATILSEEYNDFRITALIKQTGKRVASQSEEAGGGADEAKLEPNTQIQLECLQKIMLMMSQGIDTAKLFELVLNGIHKGVGLERVALLLLNQPRNQVAAKFIVGPQTIGWKEKVRYDYERNPTNFLFQVMAAKEAVLVQDGKPEALSRLLPEHLKSLTLTGSFILGPLLANNREVGFIYADLGVSRRYLAEAHFSGFKHFLQQTSLCLGILASRQKA